MNGLAEVDLEELTTRIARCETLATRARAQTSFAPEVVQRVVNDLYGRRQHLLDELQQALPRLMERCAAATAQRDEAEREVEALAFQIDELELRAVIGELEAPERVTEARAALAVAERQLAERQAEAERLLALLARCQELAPGEALPQEQPSGEIACEEDDPFALQQPELWIHEGRPEQERFVLDQPRVVVGRARGCDLQLRGDPKVSRTHLVLFQEDGAWWVEDLQPSNPTLVNGELISERRRLFGGEELILGETFVRFRWR